MGEQCRWFGGVASPEENADCPRAATPREHGLVLCEVHYDALGQDPKDWSDEANSRQG